MNKNIIIALGLLLSLSQLYSMNNQEALPSIHIPLESADLSCQLGQSGKNMKYIKNFKYPLTGRALYIYYLYYNTKNQKRYLATKPIPTENTIFYMELPSIPNNDAAIISSWYNREGIWYTQKDITTLLIDLKTNLSALLSLPIS